MTSLKLIRYAGPLKEVNRQVNALIKKFENTDNEKERQRLLRQAIHARSSYIAEYDKN